MNKQPTHFGWTGYGKGYEVSTAGDKRFSALCAKMPDGRVLEAHYQCCVKGYQPGGTDWRLGKGKPPLDTTVDLWQEYLKLWKIWAKEHPNLMSELKASATACGYKLSDKFAKTDISQARALAHILNYGSDI